MLDSNVKPPDPLTSYKLLDVSLETEEASQQKLNLPVNTVALDVLNPDAEVFLSSTPGRIGGPPKDGPYPYNSTFSTFTASVLTVACVVSSIYEFVYYIKDLEDYSEADNFYIAITKVVRAYGMILGVSALGSLYKFRTPRNRFASIIVGIASLALGLTSRSNGFKIAGPLCALSSVCWMIKTEPHELLYNCMKRIFGNLNPGSSRNIQ